ncbi:acyltransferase [Glutamicibacter sp. MNS18]|uniref:acyltransferase family protein n=1 Tax=Glutamicibacter sp. MNS18 TaxID=2989817 RepID=UPI00223588CF|nr:acyltransferase family protein [Glutamicibacter sp. MNS18]MCW4464226.1 acyltransferase [Glutamicibacter sp. MNS18]
MNPHSTAQHSGTRPAAPQAGKKTAFRTDLQGLRALAVLLVMCYHIWFNKVSGGVDIFLMLSAFFMTASMARQITSGSWPNPVRYWLKTFSRLIALAAVVIAAVVAASWLWLPGTRWSQIMDEAIASLTYRQNWELASSNVDYYAFNTSAASPLQHFWSLSVQGQIFIIWPLLLIASALLWRFVLRKLRYTTVALGVFGTIFGLSLGYSIALTASNQQLAYFHTGTRMWEFALGSLLALSLPMLQRLNERARRVGGWVGLLVIITCGAVLEVQAQFPGWLALVPTVAAALVIIAPGEPDKRNVAWLLGQKPLVKLGDVSYGMYLWHWPLLVFYLHLSQQGSVDALTGALLILVSIVLAVLSTRWIEKPLRQWKPQLPGLPAMTGRTLPVSLAQALVVVLGLILVWAPVNAWKSSVEHTRALAAAQTVEENPGAKASSDWDPQRASITLPLSTELANEWQNPGQGCTGEFAPDYPDIYYCQQGGDLDRKPDLVLLGDSHIQHWSQAVDAMIEDYGGSWMMLHEPGCRLGGVGQHDVDRCDLFQEAAVDFVAELSPEMVLTVASVTGQWEDELGPTVAEQEAVAGDYERMIEPLLDSGSRVIAMRDTPRFTFNIPECVDRYPNNLENCSRPVTELMAVTNPVKTFLAERDYGNQVVSLDMTQLLCPDGLCQPVIGNVVTYLDDSHLSKTFVASAQEIFAQRFTKATGWSGPAG